MHISAARHVRLSSVINHRSALQLPGKKKADLRACSSKFELMIFIDLEWDNATDANNLTWPLTFVLVFFSLFFWLSVLISGGWWRLKGEWKTVPNGSSYLSQETTSAQRSPSVGHVSASLSVPSQRWLAAKKKKKSKECK